jgi:hypothetical protein
MSPRQIAALLCFLVAVALAAVAVFTPPAHARLTALAVAAVAAGLAVEAAG